MIGTASKLIIYTVFAITLGYLFVSAIPAQLASPEPFLAQRGSDDVNNQISEGSESTDNVLGEVGDSGDTLGFEPPSSEISESAKATSGEARPGDMTRDYVTVFGTLALNLSIAFLVYMVARRRLT